MLIRTIEKREVNVTQINVFINNFKICFGPDRTSSGDS
jgi:hypothetical protein